MMILNNFKIFFISFILLGSCKNSEKKPDRVLFIVPKDFRGLLVVRENEHKLEHDKHKHINAEISDGFLVIRFNKNGEAYVSNIEILRSWHSLWAKFEGDEKLHVSPSDDLAVGFFSFTTLSNGDTFYYVGTREGRNNKLSSNDRRLGSVIEEQ